MECITKGGGEIVFIALLQMEIGKPSTWEALTGIPAEQEFGLMKQKRC